MLFICGATLVGYVLFVSGSTRFGAGHLVILLLGLPLLLAALFWKRTLAFAATPLGAACVGMLRVGYVLFLIAYVVCISLMWRSYRLQSEPGADAVIVLGAGLRGEEVSPALQVRLDAAIVYLNDNPDALCVLSGGRGDDERISEAEAMRRYLQRQGIDPGRLLLEDRSRDTAQNIAFSRALLLERLGKEPRVVVVTSDFHVFRGVALARGAGFSDVQGLGGRSHRYLLPVYSVRETCSIIKDGALGRLGSE
jgi:uncharacterized SAM-binding protein YcdF (DUF218 family)